MRRISYRPYIFLILFFFFLMSLPQGASQRLRSCAVCSFAPGWKGLKRMPLSQHSSDDSLEQQRLSQENQLLRSQIENVRQWLLYEDRIQEQIARCKLIAKSNLADEQIKEFFTRRSEELGESLDL